ncbi:MAG: universal stress protein [Cyanobacteria bacterium]|nr:universal stress protein [Cyanobacteriota bacterium]
MTLDIKKILVPLDFSANSELALEYARLMARRFDAALHLVHVCEVPAMGTGSIDAYAVAYTDWSQRLGEEAEKQLLERQQRLPDVLVSTEVLFGNPARGVVTAATTAHADMIVMGTHGHGPLMHVLVGNVAERVVRTAPCPVLTVRETREKIREAEKKPAAAATMCAIGALMLTLLLVPTPGLAQATEMKQAVSGGELFRTYCAACHGTAARGDGPLASSMTRKPADLTEIAKRNGGLFPSELVFRTIDGKKPIRGHGGPDMPVWGDAFARSRDGGDPERVARMIQSLVDFIESIQARPVH